MSTTYYIATQTDSHSSNGYLVANGESFVARSGGYGKGNVPEGVYKLGPQRDLANSEKHSMSKGRKDWRKYKKFGVSGVGPQFKEGQVPDGRPGRGLRKGIRFHYDGNDPGTLGCIGYDTIDAQHALAAAHAAGHTRVEVIHVADDAAARAKVKELTGKDAPTNTRGLARRSGGTETDRPGARGRRRRRRRRRRGRRTADISDIKNGARMADGERTVLLGDKRLVAAHVQAPHTGGGRVAEGSPTVFVGRRRFPFGRVEDPTTDGSQVATGEDSVLVG